MYIVTDETKLSSADGYTEYTAGSATSVPWSGVTGKPSSYTPSSHTHGNVTNDGKLPTASRALISDSSKNITVSSVTDTELGYLSGVTSSVQTQLNGKSASSHTHLTSDVTDLLNGNHTWSGDNTYSKTIVSQSNEVLSTSSTSIGIGETPANEQQKVFNFKDKNNDSLSYFRHLYKTTGASQLDFIVRNKFASGSPSTSGTIGYTSFSLELGSDGSKTGTLQATFKPSATNTYDLGTSSYKWRKVYSDDVVHTSGDESVSGTKSFNSDLNLNYASTDVDDIVNSVAGSATLDNFVHMTGNETVNGIKSFPDGVIANVTGSATSATNDGSGNVISSTYGKLGVTNEWTGNQYYTGMMILNSTSDVVEQFRQKLPHDPSVYSNAQVRFNTLVDSAGHNVVVESVGHWDTYVSKSISLKYKNDKQGVIDFRVTSDGTGILYPQSPFECTLGNSTNYWNDVWAKSYGCRTTYNIGTVPQTENAQDVIRWRSSEGVLAGGIQNYQSSIYTGLRFFTRNSYKNGTLDPTGTASGSYFNLLQDSGATSFILWSGLVNNNITPKSNDTFSLGTSINKWKSFNGINPGALSLPNGNAQDTSWIGDLTVKDGSNYNFKTFTLNGWITINIPNTSGNLVVVNNGCGQIITNEANGIAGNNCAVFMPVVANVQVSIIISIQTGESVTSAIFSPCLGNV